MHMGYTHRYGHDLIFYCLSRMAQSGFVLRPSDDLEQVCVNVLISLVLQFDAGGSDVCHCAHLIGSSI
jgi:hypothetical protein